MPRLVIQCEESKQLLLLPGVGCGCMPRREISCMCGKAPARWVEYMRWSCSPKGISFFYYCDGCWHKPGPYGDTPAERDSIVRAA
jgi:hypothetical protein